MYQIIDADVDYIRRQHFLINSIAVIPASAHKHSKVLFTALPLFPPPCAVRILRLIMHATTIFQEGHPMSNRFSCEITVPDGFTVTEEHVTMPLDAAARLLRTKRRRRYTSALKCADTAVLTRHFFTCPHCRRRTPAYPHFAPHKKCIPSDVTRRTVAEWSAPQLSMFENDNSMLYLNKPMAGEQVFSCPCCGIVSYPAAEPFRVSMGSHDSSIVLSRTTFTLDALFSMLPEDDSISFLPPITESVIFDFSAGKVFLSITDTRGTQLCRQDVSTIPNIWNNSALYILLCSNTLVQRKLRQLFSAHMQMPFPFSDYELSAERFVTVTRFQGFPRGFYDAIPYTVKTGLLDESFEAVSPALRNADNLPALYNGSGLPQMKTLRKVFFTNPGFFFYLTEAASLWNIIQDPNLFRTMLNLPGIYKLFAFLHQFPGTADFFRNYTAVHGAKSLTDLLANFSGSVKQFAIQYSAMSPAARKHETFIFERDHNLLDFTLSLTYSTPVYSSETEPIPDTIVNGFRFLRLRTTRDYTATGRALNNCLNSAYPSDNVIICIEKDSEILAAIEIKDDLVLQARTHGNADMDKSPQIYAAYKKWAKHNALRILSEDSDVEPGNELPL